MKEVSSWCVKVISCGYATTVEEALLVRYIQSPLVHPDGEAGQTTGFYVLEVSPIMFGPERCVNFNADPRLSTLVHVMDRVAFVI